MKKRCLRASFCFVYFDRKKSLVFHWVLDNYTQHNNNTTKTLCLIKN